MFPVTPKAANPGIGKGPGMKWEFAVEKKNRQHGGGILGKTLKFRAVTLVTTLGITWLLTGNPVTSVGITAIQQGTNTMVYYYFEKREKQRAG